jgi:hypothetical protein
MILWTVAFRHDTYVHVTWPTLENFSTHNAFSSIALVYYSDNQESSRSDWGSNPRPTATLPTTLIGECPLTGFKTIKVKPAF